MRIVTFLIVLFSYVLCDAQDLSILQNLKFQDMKDWKPGMHFYAPTLTAREKELTSSTELQHCGQTSKSAEGINSTLVQNKLFTLDSINKDEMYFLSSDKECYAFTKTYLRRIPGMFYADEIDTVRKYLIGKTVYTMTTAWGRNDEQGQDKIATEDTRRYYPVKITAVEWGSLFSGDYRIYFDAKDVPPAFIRAYFSGTNISLRKPENYFFNTFSIEDPHKKYKQISAKNWATIQKAKITIGMTEEECTLAWDKPIRINETNNTHGKHTQWVYDNNTYLYFDNGILKSSQNLGTQ